MMKESNKQAGLASFAGQAVRGASLAALAGMAAWAFSASSNDRKDAAGQTVALATGAANDCDVGKVHLVTANGRDVPCAINTQQAVVQQRASAAAYVYPAGY